MVEEEETLGTKIRRNTRAALITFGWGQFLIVVRMLVLFQYLSSEGYALWVFAFSIATYFTIYNFGIANAFVNYTAELNAQKNYDRLNGLISTGMIVALGFAATVALILLLFTDQAVRFFNIHENHVSEARFVVIGVGLTSALNIAFNAYPAILTGLHRLYVVNYCRVAVLTVEVGVTFALLTMGYGLRTVMVLYMLGVIASNVTTAVFAHRYLPELRIRFKLARWEYFKDMLNLGSRLQLLGIVALFVSTLDIVVFMKFGSEAMVGLYAISQRVAERAQGIARQGFGALAPASAELLAQDETGKAQHVYNTANRFTALISTFVFAYIGVHADFIMHFVMDEQYDPMSVWILRWLALANFVHSMTGPGSSMLRGAGAPMRETIYQIVIMLVFLGSFYVLHETWGNTSDAYQESFRQELLLTWPLALVVGSLIFIVMSNRFFRVSMFAPFEKMLPLLLAGVGLAWGIHYLWFALGLPSPVGRWDALLICFVTGSIYAMLFAVASWFLPGLTETDREQFIRFIPGARRFLRAER